MACRWTWPANGACTCPAGAARPPSASKSPRFFFEPGVFLLRPDQTIYYLSVQSMPFVRPNFAEMVQALDFVIKNNYPARGEYAGTV